MKHQLNKAAQEPLKEGPDLIELSNKVKYLRGVLHNTLNFELHVSLKVQKAMANVIKIKPIHKYITREAYTTLVLMLYMSHLDYSNVLFYGLPNKTIQRYQVIQNICAKLVLGRPKYSSSTQALKCLHWLPILKRITYKVGLLTFKCINKASLKTCRSTSPSESQHEKICDQTTPVLYWKYQKIKHKTFTVGSFKYADPQTWNSFPK